jgi:hypothetical protein
LPGIVRQDLAVLVQKLHNRQRLSQRIGLAFLLLGAKGAAVAAGMALVALIDHTSPWIGYQKQGSAAGPGFGRHGDLPDEHDLRLAAGRRKGIGHTQGVCRLLGQQVLRSQRRQVGRQRVGCLLAAPRQYACQHADCRQAGDFMHSALRIRDRDCSATRHRFSALRRVSLTNSGQQTAARCQHAARPPSLISCYAVCAC